MMTVPDVPDSAVAAALAAHRRALSGMPYLAALTTEALLREILEAAMPHLVPQAPDLTGERWRQGGHYPPAVWAMVGETGGKPGTHAGTMDTDKLAARACADHNMALDLRWLFSRGLGVRVTPDPEFFPGGSDGVMLYEVVLSDLEGEHLLTVDRQPSLGAALAEARRQAEGAAP